MSKIATEYYGRKFGNDIVKTYVHVVREIGELARALETNNLDLAKLEITETAALLYFLAEKYGFDLNQNIEAVYKKKLESQKATS